MEKIDELLDRIQFLVEQAERTFFPAARTPEWDYLAYRWSKREGLRGIANAHVVMLEDLVITSYSIHYTKLYDVHKDAGELVADGAVEQGGNDGGVDAAGEAEENFVLV